MKVTDLNTNVLLPAIPRTGSVTAGKRNTPLNDNEARLMETCRDFESIFIGELLKSMRKTVPQGGLLGKSFGQDVFQSMLDDEYAKQMAASHSTGLAEILFQQLRSQLTSSAED